MWRSMLLLVSSLVVSNGADITVPFELMQHWDTNFEGRFCFDLPKPIIGFQIKMHFSQGVQGIQQWEGNFVENPSGCATDLTMVNQDSHGAHPAGQYCVRMMGKLCGSGDLSGTATMLDLSDDGMKAPVSPHVTGVQEMKYDYPLVLEDSILFYEAQRSGKLPPDNRIPWRGDSGLQDAGANGEDLTGGWYDAGDNVKFNFPMAFSTTVLCWGLLEFKEAYEKAGQLDYMYDSIRWPLQYLIKCHTKPNELYAQVGSGGADHGTWTSPERMDPNRPAYKIDASKPGSELAMETAAAMACGSMAFKSKDPTFSQTLLSNAKELYDFGKNHQGFYSTSVPDAAAYYQSQNYTDENNWGAIWLYKASGESKYLEDAKTRYPDDPAWGFAWDEKFGGNHVLMYNLTGDSRYLQDIEASMNAWSKSGGMKYTPKCLAYRLDWGPLRYSANMAFLALMSAHYGVHPDAYRLWALCQIHYALGDTGRSYVVGFGTNPPQSPHHRASSCPLLPAPCGWEAQQNSGPNPHVLYGALVGGPGSSDDYNDDRKDYTHNEVACDYNAGFQSAVAGLLQLAIDHKLPNPSQCASCPQPNV